MNTSHSTEKVGGPGSKPCAGHLSKAGVGPLILVKKFDLYFGSKRKLLKGSKERMHT